MTKQAQNLQKSSAGEVDFYKILLAYAIRLLAKKSYTEHELTSKLVLRCKKVGIEEGAVEDVKRVIARLRELGYIDDAKILDNFLHFSVPQRPMGKFGFLHKMNRRGISFAQAEKTWNQAHIDESSLARSLARDRLRRYRDEPKVVQRKKLMTFLAGRGFAPDVIFEILDDMVRE